MIIRGLLMVIRVLSITYNCHVIAHIITMNYFRRVHAK